MDRSKNYRKQLFKYQVKPGNVFFYVPNIKHSSTFPYFNDTREKLFYVCYRSISYANMRINGTSEIAFKEKNCDFIADQF